MGQEPIYKNLESLDPVKKLLQEADAGLNDPTRTIKTSSMPEFLGAAAGAGVGAAASLTALYFAGTVGLSAAGITSGLATAGGLLGGGMVVGIGVLAAPVAILGIAGHWLVSSHNRRRLIQAKEALIQQIIATRDVVLRQLADRVTLSEERARYLDALNIRLGEKLTQLKSDLAPA